MAVVRDLYWLTSDTDIQRIENGASGPIYVGHAAPGTATSDTKWQIRKITYSDNMATQVDFAQGSPAFNFSWDLRATYSYS